MFYCALFLLPVLLSGCVSSQQSPQLNGTPAPWTTQLIAAQQAAQAVDSQAVLIEVNAMPISNGKGLLPLETRFEFVRPSQDTIRVSLIDTNISQTIETTPNNSRFLGVGYPSKEDLEHTENALAIVKISATKALQNTIAEGQAFAERENEKANVIVSLQFDQKTKNQVGLLAA